MPLQAWALRPDRPLLRQSPKLIAAAVAVWVAFAVQAQGTPSPDRPALPSRPAPVASADPLNPQAQVPAAVYVSPLSTYRRLGEDKRVPWTQANETVNRIGGWRSYAREAQQPDTAAPGPLPQVGPTPVASTAPGAAASAIPSPAPGHRGHGLR
jgi:hypothetical protein